jgi:hypothetical protein
MPIDIMSRREQRIPVALLFIVDAAESLANGAVRSDAQGSQS